jgi:hypothetical protein
MLFRMVAGVAAGLAFAGASADAAPFDAVSFRKGQSALVYDVGSVTRDGVDARAWVYLIVAHPMDGATMVATYREFGCGMGRTRDIARRFVSPDGRTLRAVETPGEWQDVSPGDERFDLLQQVCAGKPTRVSGQKMSVFDFQTVVRDALGAR